MRTCANLTEHQRGVISAKNDFHPRLSFTTDFGHPASAGILVAHGAESHYFRLKIMEDALKKMADVAIVEDQVNDFDGVPLKVTGDGTEPQVRDAHHSVQSADGIRHCD